jgi:hypothetical protein
MSIYVRIKRQKQTIFMHCEPNDTALELKAKIASLGHQAPIENIRLLHAEGNFPLGLGCATDGTTSGTLAHAANRAAQARL